MHPESTGRRAPGTTPEPDGAGTARDPSRTVRRDPAAALELLLEGNRRFAEGRPHRPNQSATHRQLLGDGQAPFACVLGCSDSRASVELLFDQGFGDLFVVRNAGHVVGRGGSAQASVEFAVEVLGVSVLLVLGHESCGAVAASVAHLERGTQLPGAMGILVDLTRGHLDADRPSDSAIERHVAGTIDVLLTESELVRLAVEAGRLTLAGGVYGLRDGRVRIVRIAAAGASSDTQRGREAR